MNYSDKIPVRVIFPALSEKYDFLISAELTVSQAIREITREISDHEKNDSLFNDISLYRLFTENSDHALDENTALKEYGIVSGSRIMLI